MKTLRSTANLTPSWPLEQIAPAEQILFFDIETTGFSANVSAVCLIGCLYYETSSASWQIIQWFSETSEDEPALLHAFFSFLKNYTVLIHYNGDAFDLPFIRRRSQFHSIDTLPSIVTNTDTRLLGTTNTNSDTNSNTNLPPSGITSIDLYRKIRPWKTALSLTSLKQKAIEQFLGIRRTDPYTGRQLIAVYQEYLSTRKNALCRLLLEHNAQDLCGLVQLLPLLTYAALPEMTFSLIRRDIISGQAPRNTAAAKTEPNQPEQNTEPTKAPDEITLELLCRIPDAFGSFPVPFRIEKPLFSFQGQNTHLLCRIPMYRGELKYFYPDYKNYYYLPLEDMAVHKSVGSYVAKEAREKASPQTCYVKKSGLFLPQLTPLWQPVFYLSYQSRPAYVEYREELFSDPQNLSAFFCRLFPKP